MINVIVLVVDKNIPDRFTMKVIDTKNVRNGLPFQDVCSQPKREAGCSMVFAAEVLVIGERSTRKDGFREIVINVVDPVVAVYSQ